MQFLYHGSPISGLKRLEPHKRFTPAGNIEYHAVYASSLPLVAAAHSFPWTSDEGVDFVVKGESVMLVVPQEIRDRLLQSVSVYTISAITFRHTAEDVSGYTWDSQEVVDVIEEKKYPSVEAAFADLGGSISFV